eukprot:TRINITY_DN64262_c0_g1_i1.p1 TRINITY_DN64262_c0_g1~~TRINITY_DN64262_c0_g1_i1.p1  ORF type:complete len:571 (+),score=58.37 TRINITY_DN64262_c0_g1_i1:108-1715(+)
MDDGWDLFENHDKNESGVSTGSCNFFQPASGVPAPLHPYFVAVPSGRNFKWDDLVPNLQSAIDEFLPTSFEVLGSDAAFQPLKSSLRAAVAAFRHLGRTCQEQQHDANDRCFAEAVQRCEEASRRGATEAWNQLKNGCRSEAHIYSHAFAHAMLSTSILIGSVTDETQTEVSQGFASGSSKRLKLVRSAQLPVSFERGCAKEALRHADLALLLSPDLPIVALHNLLECCAACCCVAEPVVNFDEGLPWVIPSQLHARLPNVPVVQHPIDRQSCRGLSVAQFRSERLQLACPVVIEGHLDAASWTAPRKWADLRFWAGKHGSRSVPVELGVREDDSASNALATSNEAEGSMEFADFVNRFLLPSNAECVPTAKQRPAGKAPDEWLDSPVAYLAQHTIFFQIAELQEDISIPQYCALGSVRTVNMWLGTAGTVTALHYDNDDNFLAQVSGFKYVRLYNREESERLYATSAPRSTSASCGASFCPVRVELPDLEAHPLFASVPFQETILGPGDMLFIPRHTWHYLRSLTTSLSVNVWF